MCASPSYKILHPKFKDAASSTALEIRLHTVLSQEFVNAAPRVASIILLHARLLQYLFRLRPLLMRFMTYVSEVS
jgi:hypothetical protein